MNADGRNASSHAGTAGISHTGESKCGLCRDEATMFGIGGDVAALNLKT
jgi:hypothetical protein